MSQLKEDAKLEVLHTEYSKQLFEKLGNSELCVLVLDPCDLVYVSLCRYEC